jgi:peptidyl-prolyl cis-trans isomerase C
MPHLAGNTHLSHSLPRLLLHVETKFVRTSFLAIVFASLTAGCSCEDRSLGGEEEVRDPVTGLSPSEAKEVLVIVGDRTITLGDYVATLQRMDRFERLRYQSEERQKGLLDEMIEVELLAQEARRRGLDKDPEVELQLAQALRDELLRKLEADLPPPEAIGEREVLDYFRSHQEEFKEPERRRILAIRVGKREIAEEILAKAQGGSGQTWGELAEKHSSNREKVGERGAAELAGDLGFVSAPGQPRGENENVPAEVRAAVFGVQKVGDVAAQVVEAEGSFFVVKMGGLSPARDRSLTDAERTIRVELRRRKFLQAEKDLEEGLRKKYPVVIDEAALRAYQPKAPASGDVTSPAQKPQEP